MWYSPGRVAREPVVGCTKPLNMFMFCSIGGLGGRVFFAARPGPRGVDNVRSKKSLLRHECAIDPLSSSYYITHILAHEGRRPETILKAERGVVFRGCGS